MVSIITLNYNQHDYSTACVISLLETKNIDFHVYLIDNGSTEENYQKLKDLIPKDERLSCVRVKDNRGYVGGINFGLDQIDKEKTDFVMILNNDTIIDKFAADELVKTCLSFDQKAIVTGKVYHYDEPEKLQDVGYSYKSKKNLKFNRIGLDELDKGQYDQVEERDMLDDVFWLFPTKLLDDLKGYSPYFWFNAEQADFALRAKSIGFKLIYTPTAKLWHKGSVSIGGREKNPRLAYWHIQSTLIFRFLHLNKGRFLMQYLKLCIAIAGGFGKVFLSNLTGKKVSYDYVRAKLMGLNYFNKWFFVRNHNTGHQPF